MTEKFGPNLEIFDSPTFEFNVRSEEETCDDLTPVVKISIRIFGSIGIQCETVTQSRKRSLLPAHLRYISISM